MAKFTQADSKELGLSLPLLHKWEFVMDTLWRYFMAYAKAEKQVKIENPPNKIFFQLKNGHKFKIVVNFINSKYLQLNIEIEGKDYWNASIDNIDEFSEEGIIRIVSNILTYAEYVK